MLKKFSRRVSTEKKYSESNFAGEFFLRKISENFLVEFSSKNKNSEKIFQISFYKTKLKRYFGLVLMKNLIW